MAAIRHQRIEIEPGIVAIADPDMTRETREALVELMTTAIEQAIRIRNKQEDSEYEIEALTKGLLVLEAIRTGLSEPVTIATVMRRTGFTRDFCFRALRTLRLNGYAHQTRSGSWMPGAKQINFGI